MRFLVQHHPSRAGLLERFPSSFQVVTDPAPDAAPSPWRTYRQCLLELDGEPGVIVQDDAVLCDGFVELATAAAEDCACRVVCLFVSFQARQAVSEMNWVASEGGGFAKIGNDHFIPAVANAWPGWAARQVVEWADANARSLGKGIADDGVLATACRALEIEVWATVPSLVQHLDEVPSLMSERVGQKYRRAALPHPSLPV